MKLLGTLDHPVDGAEPGSLVPVQGKAMLHLLIIAHAPGPFKARKALKKAECETAKERNIRMLGTAKPQKISTDVI